MKNIIPLLLLFIGLSAHGQSIPKNPNKTDRNNLRQGKWTILFDEKWEMVKKREKAAFYRIIEYENDKPVGLYRNYYISGELQLEGRLLQDRPKNIFDGTITWFRKDGSISATRIYVKGRFINSNEHDEEGRIPLNFTNLNNWGVGEFKQGNYLKAIEWFEKAKVQSKLESVKKHNKYFSAINHCAVSYQALGDYDQAESYYLEAKSLADSLLGDESPRYLKVLNNLAALYYDQGNYDKAEPFFLEAKNVKKKVLGKDHHDYATALGNLGTTYQALGIYAKAIALYKEQIKIQGKLFGENDYRYALSLNNLAILYLNQGRYDLAESSSLQAKKIQGSVLGKEHADYAETLSTLASIYLSQSLYAEAETIFNEVIDIQEKRLGKLHPEYAKSLYELASLYLNQGIVSRAESLVKTALDIQKEALGNQNTDYAKSLSLLAAIYKSQKEYGKSEQLYKEVLAIEKEILGENHENYISSLVGLANLYKDLGSYTEAETLYKKGIILYDKATGKESQSYGYALGELADIYIKQGRYHDAEKLLLEKIDIYEKTFGKQNASYALSLYYLAKLYLRQGLLDKAEPLFYESADILLKHIINNFSQLSEKEKRVFLANYAGFFEYINSFAIKQMQANPKVVNKIYQIVLTTKGMLFEAQQKIKQKVLKSGDTELIGMFDEWKSQCSYLSKLYEKSNGQLAKEGINLKEEQNRANELEKNLSSKSQIFSSSTKNTLYNWQDVQQQLGENEAAIELIRLNYFDKNWTGLIYYMAMIVTPNTQNYPEVIVFNNGVELESTFLKYYKNNIKFKLNDEKSYEIYWGQIQQKLKGVKKLYLSADGVYHSLSLGGLYNPEKGVYLADELDIQLVSSTRDLVKEKRKRNPKDRIELMGFPDYNTAGLQTSQIDVNQYRELSRSISVDSTSRFFNGQDIPLLYGTRQEIDNMQEIMERANLETSVYLNTDASEANVKTWDNPKVAHIATHGYFLKDDDIAHEEGKVAGISKDAYVGNPLLRSGLLLTNAKQAIEYGGDGVLTAYEAQNLNLDDTELVVLSACETGLGDVQNGEGVYGLQRAFQTAGASSVLMSLWTVSDNATQELMTGFYENWLIKEQAKRQAFKNAQKKLREKYPHPYYWAAFVLAGE